MDEVQSLEEAARGSIPERYARVLWSEVSVDRGAVLLEVNTTQQPYYDISWCWVEDGAWCCDSAGANGDERPEDCAEWLQGSGPG
jgi:hypothetical protein